MSNEFEKDPWGTMKYIDKDGHIIEIQRDGENAVYIECIDGNDGDVAGVHVPGAALIEAIEETLGIRRTDAVVGLRMPATEETERLADIEPDTSIVQGVFDEPEPLWIEVRERPARAFKVTPELVRTLAGDEVPDDLEGLEPEFDRSTGEPVGARRWDSSLAQVGDYIVVDARHGACAVPSLAFERVYEVAA